MPKKSRKQDDGKGLHPSLVPLVPCPFCGPCGNPMICTGLFSDGNHAPKEIIGTSQVICLTCGISSPRCRDFKNVRRLWNKFMKNKTLSVRN